MKKSLTVFIWIWAAVLVISACAAGFAALRYRSALADPAKPEIIEPPLVPDNGVGIAEKIPFIFKVRTPWGRELVSVSADPGKGSQTAGTPETATDSRSWGYTVRKVTVPVQPYLDGEIPEGSVRLDFEGGPDRKESVTVPLPAFRAKALPVAGNDTLALAGKIIQEENESSTRLIILVVAIFVLAVCAWILMKIRDRRHPGRLMMPWEYALSSINSLRLDLHGGRTGAETAVVLLTDIVRGYIERRFKLRAEHQTTREFLNELEEEGGPLESDQRGFLRDFLSSADMVKFAKLPADVKLFDRAAEKAESLVRSTALDDEGREALD